MGACQLTDVRPLPSSRCTRPQCRCHQPGQTPRRKLGLAQQCHRPCTGRALAWRSSSRCYGTRTEFVPDKGGWRSEREGARVWLRMLSRGGRSPCTLRRSSTLSENHPPRLHRLRSRPLRFGRAPPTCRRSLHQEPGAGALLCPCQCRISVQWGELGRWRSSMPFNPRAPGAHACRARHAQSARSRWAGSSEQGGCAPEPSCLRSLRREHLCGLAKRATIELGGDGRWRRRSITDVGIAHLLRCEASPEEHAELAVVGPNHVVVGKRRGRPDGRRLFTRISAVERDTPLALVMVMVMVTARLTS